MNKLQLRNKVVVGFGLNDKIYDDVAEAVITNIKNDTILQYADVKSAIDLSMMDFRVKNAPFYDGLKDFYTEHYHLIPILGIDGLLDVAVESTVRNGMLEDKVVDAVNKALAFDFAIQKMKEGVEYNDKLMDYLNGISVGDFLDITEMLNDVAVALDVYEVKNEKVDKDKAPKQKVISIAPGINVVILDDDGIADDLLALLKILNGGN